MCLSKVFLKERQNDNVFVEESSRVIVDDETICVDNFMGERKTLQHYFISEVNFIENYVILKPKGKVNAKDIEK